MKNEFDKLLENTRKDGTPFLKHEYAKKLKFKSINLKPGDLLFFSHLCPHKSDKNNSANKYSKSLTKGSY